VISIQTRTNQLDFGDHVQESFYGRPRAPLRPIDIP